MTNLWTLLTVAAACAAVCDAAVGASSVWDDLRADLAAWPFGENFAFSVGNSSGSLFVFERGTTTMNSQLVMESGACVCVRVCVCAFVQQRCVHRCVVRNPFPASASKWPTASAIAGLVADGTISRYVCLCHAREEQACT